MHVTMPERIGGRISHVYMKSIRDIITGICSTWLILNTACVIVVLTKVIKDDLQASLLGQAMYYVKVSKLAKQTSNN
jgi:hypothetical protein